MGRVRNPPTDLGRQIFIFMMTLEKKKKKIRLSMPIYFKNPPSPLKGYKDTQLGKTT